MIASSAVVAAMDAEVANACIAANAFARLQRSVSSSRGLRAGVSSVASIPGALALK